jgi:hypothetical protein
MNSYPTKRALFVGIDTYSRPLNGCVNDVEMMRRLLISRFAFPKGNTSLLKNADATRQGILAAFDDLVAVTEPDDIVVIHYAGHGSFLELPKGTVPDEASGKTNTIVPVDRGPQVPDITDDDINAVLERLARKTAHTTLIFDCCHSGTITRAALPGKVRSIAPGPAKANTGELRAARLTSSSHRWGPSGWLPLADSYVLIAGCRDDEIAMETPENWPEPHGVLSWFLGQALEQAPAGTTYRDLFEQVAPRVTGMYSGETQHPQLEGRIDREIFGVRLGVPARFVPVRQRDGDLVMLAAGAAMGLKEGTRWTVHRAQTKQPTSASRCGDVTITEVHACTATARIAPGCDSEIGEAARAFEGESSYAGDRLLVVVEASPAFESSVASLEASLGASPYLRIASSNEAQTGSVTVRVRATTLDSGETTQYWEIDPGATPRLRVPGSLGAIDDVRTDLETIARYRYVLSLKNKHSALEGQIEFALQRKRRDGSWVTAVPDDGGIVVLEDGDSVGFLAQNNFSQVVQIALLAFSRSGAITQLHPPQGAKERLVPGVEFGIGMNPRATVARNIRVAAEDNAIAEAETFKLVVATNEADFWFLTQPGVRATAWRPGPPTSATRGAEPSQRAPIDDWTTVSLRYVVRPPEQSSRG